MAPCGYITIHRYSYVYNLRSMIWSLFSSVKGVDCSFAMRWFIVAIDVNIWFVHCFDFFRINGRRIVTYEGIFPLNARLKRTNTSAIPYLISLTHSVGFVQQETKVLLIIMVCHCLIISDALVIQSCNHVHYALVGHYSSATSKDAITEFERMEVT